MSISVRNIKDSKRFPFENQEKTKGKNPKSESSFLKCILENCYQNGSKMEITVTDGNIGILEGILETDIKLVTVMKIKCSPSYEAFRGKVERMQSQYLIAKKS